MNLRRRRRVRTLALTAFLLALLVWGAGTLLYLSWFSAPIPGTMPPERHSITVASGQISFANRVAHDPGSLTYGLSDRPFSRFGWLPHPRVPWWSLARARPNFGPYYFMINIPLWTPAALLIPPLLLTHWLARRPFARARRGLCHRCGYNLAATPADRPCPECGTSRLALEPRARTRGASPEP